MGSLVHGLLHVVAVPAAADDAPFPAVVLIWTFILSPLAFGLIIIGVSLWAGRKAQKPVARAAVLVGVVAGVALSGYGVMALLDPRAFVEGRSPGAAPAQPESEPKPVNDGSPRPGSAQASKPAAADAGRFGVDPETVTMLEVKVGQYTYPYDDHRHAVLDQIDWSGPAGPCGGCASEAEVGFFLPGNAPSPKARVCPKEGVVEFTPPKGACGTLPLKNPKGMVEIIEALRAQGGRVEGE
ncbi:MAG: hypothetical protein HY927_08160 [Elusimicrobia bacterium]|nr:hypothetical protein [Elusimicrobiota bacterium]